MDEYSFDDALTGNRIVLRGSSYDVEKDAEKAAEKSEDVDKEAKSSLFFPGCSFINYSPDLVQKTYDLLLESHDVEGISLLCCGKILAFEPNAEVVRPLFEQQLLQTFLEKGITSLVIACPNCWQALGNLLQDNELDEKIELIALPKLLAERGYHIEADDFAPIPWAVHDSCPDRREGIFADSLRELLGSDNLVEMERNRKHAPCCGSLARAAGKYDLATKTARHRAEEAREVQARSMVTACMSCTYLLSASQKDIPLYHYLELLFKTRIAWDFMPEHLSYRFLFDEAHGLEREFAGNV